MEPQNIITETSFLNDLRYACSRKGLKIVGTCGCFDLLHPGHVLFFYECIRYGHVLVVFVNTDRYIKEKKRKPLYTQHERLRMVASIRPVSYVMLFDDDEPSRMIRLLRPDVWCNAEHYGRECVEAEVVRSVGGELVLVGNLAPYSTSDLIRRIKEG